MCRAAMPDSTVTVHRFRDKELAQAQKELFCSSACYERCEHYKAWKHFMWEDEE